MTAKPSSLYALAVEPPAARPGEVVRLRFETPNLSCDAVHAGSVTFVLDDLLEPLDDVLVALDATPPGAAVVAEVRARVSASAGEDDALRAQAVFRTGESTYDSNAVRLPVCTQPIVDGAESGTYVTLRDDAVVTVRAVVVNEGDGAARGLCVRLPVPAGCVRIDGDDPATLRCERLGPGERLELGFDARIVAPAATIAADGAAVELDDGTRGSLAARTTVATRPSLQPPRLEIHPGRRASTIVVTLRNDGWADARDAAVAILMPPGLRASRESIRVDAVAFPARPPRRAHGDQLANLVLCGSRVDIVLDSVTARDATIVEIVAAHGTAVAGGIVRVEAGDHVATADVVTHVERTVRLRVEAAPASVAAGERIAVRAALANAGDVCERLTLAVAGLDGSPLAVDVSPGRIARAVVEAVVPDEIATGPARFCLVAADESGERVRADFVVHVRSEPEAVDAAAVAPAAAPSPAVAAWLDAPAGVDAGCVVALALRVNVDRPVDTLTICAPTSADARAISGSTTLDGWTIAERGDCTPLERGIVLRDVAGPRRIVLRWSLLAAPGARTICAAARILADGIAVATDPATIAVAAASPFAARDERLAFHLANHTLSRAADAAPPLSASLSVPVPVPVPEEVAASETICLAFAADGDALSLAARLLRGDPPPGLAGYLPLLGALLPTAAPAGASAALAAARVAIGDAFDRLHVLLRLPGFTPRAEDLEDAAQRRALVALYAALDGAADDEAALPAHLDDDRFTVSIERSQLGEVVGAFADARFGSLSAMRAIAALVPTRCDAQPLLSAALERYVRALDDALRRCERLAGDAAERAFGSGRDTALEDARAALGAALRAHRLADGVR